MAQALFYRGFGRLLFFSFPVLLFFSSCRSARNFTSPLPGEYSVRISGFPASGYKNVKRVRQGYRLKDGKLDIGLRKTSAVVLRKLRW